MLDKSPPVPQPFNISKLVSSGTADDEINTEKSEGAESRLLRRRKATEGKFA